MKKQLFIIGNGFDIEHDLPTGYSDFLEYIEYGDGAKLGGTGFTANIERLTSIPSVYFWNDFEKNLGEISLDVILEDALDQRSQFNSEFDYESFNDDNMINHLFHENFESLHLLDDLVKSWTNNVDISTITPKEKYLEIFNEDSLFLTFNYTMVLEDIYDISEEKVFHIHGSIHDEPIMGHGKDYINTYRTDRKEIDFLTEEFKATISEPMVEFYNSSSKNIKGFLNEMEIWLNNEKFKIDEIFILGHSLGEVDYPYFQYLFDKIKLADYFISYFGEYDKKKKEQHLIKIGMDSANIQLIDASNIIFNHQQ